MAVLCQTYMLEERIKGSLPSATLS